MTAGLSPGKYHVVKSLSVNGLLFDFANLRSFKLGFDCLLRARWQFRKRDSLRLFGRNRQRRKNQQHRHLDNGIPFHVEYLCMTVPIAFVQPYFEVLSSVRKDPDSLTISS